MDTLGKESISNSPVKKGQQSLRQSVEDNGQSGHPKDITTDENVKVMHSLGI